jgi:hypothetical protein
LLDYRAKEAVGDRQIEQHVACVVLPPALIDQQLLELAEGFGLHEVSAHVVHAMDKPGPRLLVDRIAVALAPPGAREGLHHLGQVPTPFLGGQVVVIDADDGKVVRELPGSHKIVERRHDETLGQIAASAENRHGGGGQRVAGETLCDSCRRICSDRCHRAPPPLSDVIGPVLCAGEGALASRPMSALLTLNQRPRPRFRSSARSNRKQPSAA